MPVLTDTQRLHPAYEIARRDFKTFANLKADSKANQQNIARYLALYQTADRFEDFLQQITYLTDIANQEPNLGIQKGRPNLLVEILKVVTKERCQGHVDLFCQQQLFANEQPRATSISFDLGTQAVLATVYDALPKREDTKSGALSRETVGELIIQETINPMIRDALSLNPPLSKRNNVPSSLVEPPADVDKLKMGDVTDKLRACISKKKIRGGTAEKIS